MDFLTQRGDSVRKSHNNAVIEQLESRQLLSAAPLAAGDELATIDWHGESRLMHADRWIIRLDGLNGNAANRLNAANTLLAGKLKATRDLGEGFILAESKPGQKFAEIQHAIKGTRGLSYIEPDFILSASALPNDTYLSYQWGVHNTGQTGGTFDADIDAMEAWGVHDGSGGNPVVVAVIDSGIDYNHPDLKTNMWRNLAEAGGAAGVDDDGNGYVDDVYGWDFYNNDANPYDDNGHGTHVAGTIAASSNGMGVAGVNYNGQVMALKFLGANGSGSTSGAISALNYATMMRETYGVNIRLTNNSWGGSGFSQALSDAIKASGDAGLLFVAAAGNGGPDRIGDNNDTTPEYPASYKLANVITVAATDHRDARASFSNYGVTTVHLGAPGVQIASTYPGGAYVYMSGTSMAAPHVAGAAALAFSYNPAATAAQVKQALLGGVDPISSMAGRTVTGGRLNLYNTLQLLAPAPAAPAAPTGLAALAVSSSQINLTWTDNASNETGYRVQRSISGGSYSLIATLPAGSTSYSSTGLLQGTTYAYRVLAYNAAGETPSNIASATTPLAPTAPAAPASLSATASSTRGQINLTWTDLSNNEQQFQVERSLSGGPFVAIATLSANVTQYTDTGLADAQTYTYRVRALNAVGPSAYSNLASATTAPAPLTAPAAPTGLAASAISASRIDLNWTDNAGNEDGYRVQRLISGSFADIATLPAGATSYSDTGLTAGTGYTYRVAAFNSAGSANSSTATATTTAAPATGGDGLSAVYYDNHDFTGKTFSRIDGTVNFNWGKSAPISGFGSDSFSVRWTGYVMPQHTQTYTFYTTTDDGVRLWVNDQLLIDRWYTQKSASEHLGSIALIAGQKYAIRMEYFESTRSATARLSWSSPSTPKAVIPKDRLYSSASASSPAAAPEAAPSASPLVSLFSATPISTLPGESESNDDLLDLLE